MAVNNCSTSDFSLSTLSSPSTVRRLQNLLRLLRSAYGAAGRVHFLRNSTEGGHVTVTSSSGRLLRLLSVREPLLQLLVSGLQQRRAADHGLLCAVLSLRLALAAPLTGLSSQLLAGVVERLIAEAVAWLPTMRVPLGASIEPLLAVTRAVLAPSRRAAGVDVEEVTQTVLQAFLHSLPSEAGVNPPAVQILCVEDCVSAAAAECVQGVVLDTQGLPASHLRLLRQCQSLSTASCSVSLVLFTCSLSGESEGAYDVTYQIFDSSSADTDSSTSLAACEALLQVCQSHGVQVLCCQKVVHPRLKRAAAARGIAVLDRLGTDKAAAVRDVAGCRAIESIVSELPPASFGKVTNLAFRQLKRRTHLIMTSTATAQRVVTLLLFGRTDEALQELQHTCRRALEVLRFTVEDGWSLSGAGCWQAALVTHFLFDLPASYSQHVAMESDCSKSLVLQSIDQMCQALLDLSVTSDVPAAELRVDLRTRHLYRAGSAVCECGAATCEDQATLRSFAELRVGCEGLPSVAVAKPCRVLDCARSVISALQCAANTSSMLLNIGSVVVEN